MDILNDPFAPKSPLAEPPSDFGPLLEFSGSESWWKNRSVPVVSFNKDLDESVVLSRSYSRSNHAYGSTGESNSTKAAHRLSSQTAASEQITLTWENIHVVVPEKKSLFSKAVTPARTILHGVAGIVKPGSLLAIMGASGSGKTTLLNVITSRNLNNLVISGDVKVEGISVGDKIKRLSGYVQQDDQFMGVLTVREHLWFQAMLRMDSSLTAEYRAQRVDDVILELGLAKCRNTAIGLPGKVKSISGGERKRLAFAAEILNNPPVMFCDEPTSGLDSFMAENVVRTLRDMASQGKTILCTIHQPSSQVFELFDNLLFLAEGRVAYMGPATGVRDFFSGQGFVCPERFNPADFYIHTLAIVPGQEDERRDRIDTICGAFEDSDANKKIRRSIFKANASMTDVVISPTAFVTNVARYKTGFPEQMKHVLWRAWLAHSRNRGLLYVRLIITFTVSTFLGILCSQTANNQESIRNINSACYYTVMFATNTCAFSGIQEFPRERPVYKRDQDNSMYRPSVYFLCRCLVDIPIYIFLPVAFCTILYWTVGLRPEATSFLTYVGTTLLLAQVGISMIYLLSIAAGTVSVALSLARPIWLPFALFGGFFINDGSIPVYFIWIKYLSWYKYGNEIMVINQWHNFGNITCNIDSNNNETYLTTPGYGNGSLILGDECLHDGEQVIASMNYSSDNLVRNYMVLLALFVTLRLGGFLALLIRTNPINVKKLFLVFKQRK